jgi:hypothetical protein
MATNYDTIVGTGDEDDPQRGGGYRQEPFWSQKEGDTSILRFLQESAQWSKALTHRFHPVSKAAPKDHEGKRPTYMSATCRKDEALARIYPDGCPICSSPGTNDYGKTWEQASDVLRYTLAVEREIVDSEEIGPDGKPVKVVRDKTVKMPVWGPDGKPVEGETVEVPSIVIVNGTMYQMFSTLKAIGASYGSLTNCDFKISRIKNPTGKGTTYQIIPIMPSMHTEQVGPGTDHWKMYMDTVSLWVPGGLRLAQLIGEKSEHEYYERFFTTNGVVITKAGGTQAAQGAPQTAAAPTPDQSALEAMKARIAKQQAPAADAPAAV